jgi:multicomponent Na+:H+ antiporter subunit E
VRSPAAILGLAVIWMAATGAFTWRNLILGAGMGWLSLWMALGRGRGAQAGLSWNPRALARRAWAMGGLALYLLGQVVVSSARVIWDALTPRRRVRPGIVATPLEELSDMEIMLLVAMVTLTPGSIVLQVSEDRRVIYVHAMYIEDAEQTRRQVKQGFERRIIRAMR